MTIALPGQFSLLSVPDSPAFLDIFLRNATPDLPDIYLRGVTPALFMIAGWTSSLKIPDSPVMTIIYEALSSRAKVN